MRWWDLTCCVFFCIFTLRTSQMDVWLVVSTPLKNMSSSVGMIISNIWKVIKFMFQTTKQMWYLHPNPSTWVCLDHSSGSPRFNQWNLIIWFLGFHGHLGAPKPLEISPRFRELICCGSQLSSHYSGWLLTYPSEKYESPVGMIIPNIRKNIKCSKPPTSTICCFCGSQLSSTIHQYLTSNELKIAKFWHQWLSVGLVKHTHLSAKLNDIYLSSNFTQRALALAGPFEMPRKFCFINNFGPDFDDKSRFEWKIMVKSLLNPDLHDKLQFKASFDASIPSVHGSIPIF